MMQKKILLTEDDPDAREIARIILELNGYQVLEAENAIQTESIFFNNQPSLLLIDLSIPGGGAKTMKRLKQSEKGKDIPILAYTALSSTDEMESLKREGFDGVVPKPCRPEEIVEIVRKFLKE